MVGTHRRLTLSDVLANRELQQAPLRDLDETTRQAEEPDICD